jgi:MFS family permease
MQECGAIGVRVAAASLVGTALEFFDLYVCGTAAATVFGPIFLPASSSAARLIAPATFALALVARPVGAVIFGYIGDRRGRMPALVASLLITGVCTTLIGALPVYQDAGIAAPIMLCILRVGQGIGFGGEWAGAAVLAVEHATPGRRARFAMFPQLGSLIGFIAANATFIMLVGTLTSEGVLNWGWRLPFLFSAVLIVVGLYVRLTLADTPVFKTLLDRQKPPSFPLGELLRQHGRRTVLGSLVVAACYTLIYLGAVLALSYGTAVLRMPPTGFLGLECVGMIVSAIAIAIAALLSDRLGRRPVLLGGLALTALFGTLLERVLSGGSATMVMLFFYMGLFLMGIIVAPLGAFLPELFPTRIRFSGVSITYSLGSILGASVTPYVVQSLADRGGLLWVGVYLGAICTIGILAVWSLGETTGNDLAGCYPARDAAEQVNSGVVEADAG